MCGDGRVVRYHTESAFEAAARLLVGPQELVNILWSLAALSYDPPTRLFSELERVYQQMLAARKFNCQVSETAPHLGLGFDRFLRGVAPREQLDFATYGSSPCAVGGVQDVANLLWGYATLGRTPAPTLLQSIAVEAVLKVEEFKQFELINVLWGFAMVRVHVGPPAQRPPNATCPPSRRFCCSRLPVAASRQFSSFPGCLGGARPGPDAYTRGWMRSWGWTQGESCG